MPPAVQLGLTATPRRKENADTYAYFGEPVYIYSLREGINDGFLTPFRVKQIATTLDEYVYTPDDYVVEGEVERGKRYVEADFNKIIEIKEREAHRVKLFMEQINQNEKTLVFCATQDHALAVRDLINQMKTSTDPNYCQRVTANDGELGNQHLRDFQDNEKTIPTILTTSQKLSTGVDARNIRNIVLMRADQHHDRVQANHWPRHPALRWQGLLHHLRLCEGVRSFQRSGMGRRAARSRTLPKVRLLSL